MIAKFTRKDFLEALFAEYYKEHRGFILVKSFKAGDPKMSTRYFPNIEILAKEHYGEERDVYFGICPRERMKAEKEHVRYLVALWADLDIGEEGHEHKSIFFEGPQHAARAIRSFPRAPSMIVESGRGAHLYWLLKNVSEVSDPEKTEKMLEGISKYLQCDTDVNLDTVLRLPETVNTKVAGKLVNCDVKFINSNFRYTLAEFENLGERIEVQQAGDSQVADPSSEVGAPPPVPGEPGDVGSEIASVVGSASGNDSLVLDETIIDELIDDISMTGSDAETPEVVTTGTAGMDDDVVADDQSPFITDAQPAPSASEPPSASYAADPAPSRSVVPPIVTNSSVLHKLSSTKASVEISLVGSDSLISGTLLWSENGLIGVEAEGHLYTIPLSSVSFIKSESPQ
jgi:hypothetical protein